MQKWWTLITNVSLLVGLALCLWLLISFWPSESPPVEEAPPGAEVKTLGAEVETLEAQRANIPRYDASPSPARPMCNHHIGLATVRADGRRNYADVGPGDTVCIEAGERGNLVLRNFRGTVDAPITFINAGGQVVISHTEVTVDGLSVEYSHFVRLSGAGEPGVSYGIKVTSSGKHGVRVGFQSRDFEVDHIEVTGVPKVGIYAQTVAACSDGSTNGYDYDGDGLVEGDLDDVVNANIFTQVNSTFHDNYIHQVGTEGFYIGSSFYGGRREMACQNGLEMAQDPQLQGVNVYANIVIETGWDGIQVGSAVADCQIHHNQVQADSQAHQIHQESGIMNARGSRCNIYANLIQDGAGPGIYLYGHGFNQVYNNLIIRPGGVDREKGHGLVVGNGSNPGNPVYVWHNTIIQPAAFGIRFDLDAGQGNQIYNNLIVAPGVLAAEEDGAYIFTGERPNVTTSHNLGLTDIAAGRFFSPTTDNYRLLTDSPARNTGVASEVTLDFDDRSRGDTPDIGAFEGP